MSNPKCNLTPEEQEEALKNFSSWLTVDELEQAQQHFEQYIFFDTWGRRNFREYFCPNCGRFELEGPWAKDIYTENPFKVRHGEPTVCPMCGTVGTLICLGRVRTMRSLHQWEKLCFMRQHDGRLYIEAGFAEISYSHDDLRPYPEFYPTARYVVEPGRRQPIASLPMRPRGLNLRKFTNSYR